MAATRRPTGGEQAVHPPWDDSYRHGPAPWEIGAPQPSLAPLIESGAFVGPVLDAGCGTGEHAMALAARGYDVVGVDVAGTALAKARAVAADRGLTIEFVDGDALDLAPLGRRFASVLDCGLLHTLGADERPRYAASLASVTDPGAVAHILCFSDLGGPIGPHPIGENDIRAAFTAANGWELVEIAPAAIHTLIAKEPFAARLVTARRIAPTLAE
ncbi:class I SAM-dependent methyltransferase [Jongsikchunia kroppenstedtii]|uniref:class I SAM-dependent methyltransferase n=1 Tax=Jongsikchunia kroppenstedtii TaxID=1121721 RepID=UPI000368EFD0|nr:class I SAM-dependent methyltransferase [Jongsikchunia kroppenstedtii]